MRGGLRARQPETERGSGDLRCGAPSWRLRVRIVGVCALVVSMGGVEEQRHRRMDMACAL